VDKPVLSVQHMLNSTRLQFIAEDTLLIEFARKLDDAVHKRVLNLDAALCASGFASHIETLPTFRSLLIKFDVLALTHEALLQGLSDLETSQTRLSPQSWRVPVCLERTYAEDLPEVAKILHLPEAEVIARLLKQPLKLYMYGFAPGFAYLGGLDSALNIPRRATPRSPMPRSSLMIAGGLASLTSVSMPTGWYVVGQSPVDMFSLQRESLVPFAIGDVLQLYQIGVEEFKTLQASELAGVEKKG